MCATAPLRTCEVGNGTVADFGTGADSNGRCNTAGCWRQVTSAWDRSVPPIVAAARRPSMSFVLAALRGLHVDGPSSRPRSAAPIERCRPASRGRVVNEPAGWSSLARRWAGVSQPRVLRGRPLSSAATASRSSRECTDRSVPLGKYWRSRPLVRYKRIRGLVAPLVDAGRVTPAVLISDLRERARLDGTRGPWHAGLGPLELSTELIALRNAIYVLVAGLSMMRDSEIRQILNAGLWSSTAVLRPCSRASASAIRARRSSTGGSATRSPRPSRWPRTSPGM